MPRSARMTLPTGSDEIRRGCSGFTIVEVLVTVLFVLAALVAILGAFGRATTVLGEPSAALRAGGLLKEKMADVDAILAAGQPVHPAESGSFAGKNSDFLWQWQIGPATGVPGNSSVGLSEIVVTVWRRSSTRRYSACTWLRSDGLAGHASPALGVSPGRPSGS